MHGWLDDVIDGPVGAELTESGRADSTSHARSDALGQKLLSLTVPGIPDVYQGTELWDDSLVDPDNRRPVDYAGTARGVEAVGATPRSASSPPRCSCAANGPTPSCPAATRPCWPRARPREHVVAFLRGDDVLVAVQPVDGRPAETGWGDTALALPDGEWTDRLTGRRFQRPSPCRRNCSPSCRWHCWRGPMPDHEFAVWAPTPGPRATRRRRRAAPDDAIRRRLVAGDRRRARRQPLRLRPRRRRHRAARPALAPPARRRARPLAAVGPADGCVDRRRLDRPLDRGRGHLRTARRHVHRRRHVRLGDRAGSTTSSTSASTSSS